VESHPKATDVVTLNIECSCRRLQVDLLKQIRGNLSSSQPLVVVIISGGPISEPWLFTGADAILWSSYMGQVSCLA
jgi:hypothetical protein